MLTILYSSIGAWAQSAFTEESTWKPLQIGEIGVVELPSLLPELEGVVKSFAPVPIRKDSNVTAPLVMIAKVPRDILTREIGYGSEAAVVYSLRPGWFLIQSRFGKGWVSQKSTGKFTSLEMLIQGEGHYLTAEWDGVLRKLPSVNGEPISIKWTLKDYPGPDDRLVVNVLSFQWNEGQLWVNIELSKSIFCSNLTCLDKEITGWIPAYSPKGNLIIWFFAEGC